MKIGPKTPQSDPVATPKVDLPAPQSAERLQRSTMPEAAKLRSIGVDPAKTDTRTGIGASKILDVFGASQFAEFPAVKVPGKVAWVNFELARELGFDVPPGNKMTPEFEAQLIDALSFRAVKKGEDVGDAETITMYADKYGGTNVGQNKGAGRAGFMEAGNFNIKGVGITPLAVANPNDFQHSHGGAPLREGLVEAMWGELNTNLFTQGSTRILAVIDNNDYTEWADGSREHRALIVRAGTQFRPAHLLQGFSNGRSNAGQSFVNATRETGELVTVTNAEGDQVPDLDATKRNVVKSHARAAAEQIRWRILHGALSTSNMEINGAQLDLATESAQPRSAPMGILDFLGDGGRYGTEHTQRASQLQRVFSGIDGSLSHQRKTQWNAKKINVAAVMQTEYKAALRVQLLCATGLKLEMAEALVEKKPALAKSFSECILSMLKLRNPGETNADKTVLHDISVFDVFGALGSLPATYFDDPTADLGGAVRSATAPIIGGKGHAQNRTKKTADRLIGELAVFYPKVMEAATELASEHYDDDASMKRSVIQRSAFENKPMPSMYRAVMNDQLTGAITAYEKSGDTRIFTEAVDKTVATSTRNVEALIGQGAASKLADGGVELGARTIDGVDYAVRAWEGGKRRVHLAMPVEGNDHSGYRLQSLDGGPHLHRDQIDQLSYRFSTDGWKSYQEVPAKLEGGEVTFDIPVLKSDVGQLEGLFHCTGRGDFWLKDANSNFRGYTYAIPDNRALADINARL